MWPWLLMLSLWLPLVETTSRLTQIETVEGYMNICMDGVYQKETPGPGDLYGHCSEWKDRNCCYENTTRNLQKQETWQNFNLNHCSQKKNMSSMCREHFIQNFCFYECSPNVGPWLVQVSGMDTRRERFYKVPLCKHECDLWWEDCREDFTCVKNWETDFDWDTGSNMCPVYSSCQKFSDIYRDSTEFCQSVFDSSYNVMEETDQCMVLHFLDKNPNEKVARQQAELYLVNQSNLVKFSSILYLLVFYVMFLF